MRLAPVLKVILHVHLQLQLQLQHQRVNHCILVQYAGKERGFDAVELDVKLDIVQ